MSADGDARGSRSEVGSPSSEGHPPSSGAHPAAPQSQAPSQAQSQPQVTRSQPQVMQSQQREGQPQPSETRHPSLEKTDRNLGAAVGEALRNLRKAAGGDDAAGGPATDLAILKGELEAKQKECGALQRSLDQARTEIEAVRSDFSVRMNERVAEIRTLTDLFEKAQAETKKLEAEIADLKHDNKQLKAQNLGLQHRLNSWGIPVATGQESRTAGGEPTQGGRTFFPEIAPLAGDQDPIPVSLRGDVSILFFPDLLHFLANGRFHGVVTVLADPIVSKLYVDGPVLRLAGWNNRDGELGLLTLLDESELVARDVCEELRQRSLFDYELAKVLVAEKEVPVETVRLGLREHARVILSYLFQMRRGSFFFQRGQVSCQKELQFRLLITDVLLKTAAEMDEKTRTELASVP